MPLLRCRHCGVAFKVKQSRIDQGKGIFCSRKCFWASRRTGCIIRRCAHCGVIFSTKHEAEIYCSRQCTQKAEGEEISILPEVKAIKRYCRICDTAFEPEYEAQRFCSKACEKEYKGRNGITLLDDPWASGAIPPDCYDRDYYRMPDLWLGF